MSFDLSNVNISLQQFQDISSGKYNAGEVRLADESNLKKMNNHVHRTGKNTEVISHDEVLAIKEALVKALSAHGVEEDEISRVRRELGLAPGEEGDRTMGLRSIKPLSRQQIREILDRNASTINSSHGPNGDKVYIGMSAGVDANRAEKRDAVAAQLSRSDRQVGVNMDVAAFQLVVSDNAHTAARGLPYLRNDDTLRRPFSAPPAVVNFFYHEEIKKSAKRTSREV